MTWNPSSLKTIHSHPSPKINHILKLAKTHVCHIQETQWSSLQYNHLLQQSPFCTIFHTPAIEASSSGVATLLPRSLSVTSHSVIEPGFILSVSTEVCGLTCEFINIYLHPDQVVKLAQTLLRHLQNPPSRAHQIRIIGGDFNQLPPKSLLLFESILNELDTAAPPFHPPIVNLMDTSARLTSFSSNSYLIANISFDPNPFVSGPPTPLAVASMR